MELGRCYPSFSKTRSWEANLTLPPRKSGGFRISWGYNSGFSGGVVESGSIASRQNPDFCLFSLKKTICFSRFYVSLPSPNHRPVSAPVGTLWYFGELEPLATLYPPLPKANFSRFRSTFFANIFRDFAKVSPPNYAPGSASALKMVWFTYHKAC